MRAKKTGLTLLRYSASRQATQNLAMTDETQKSATQGRPFFAPAGTIVSARREESFEATGRIIIV